MTDDRSSGDSFLDRAGLIFSKKVGPLWLEEWSGRANERTIKDATVKRFHYDDHNQLRQHLADLVSAYNFGRRLKTLKGLTPHEYICKSWTTEPDRFILNPISCTVALGAHTVNRSRQGALACAR